MQPSADDLASHWESVWRFVLRHVGDESLADDLTQETFLRAQRAFDRYRREASVRSWLFAIALNAVRDHFRALRRAPESASLTAGVEPSADAGSEQAVALSEMAACVEEHLLQLPRAQHDVVTLHDVAGMSHGEIASTLGVSVGNSRVLLHRGRAALRKVLQQNCILSFDGDAIPCTRRPATGACTQGDPCAGAAP